ncbi:conserved protein of unknown function [Rhodovastum atsumiense]|uniref:Outer membrane protein assembly factor BamE n=1 Tax=Rhodovastum atsumiense TaxID=504468 RepID=A0A5M6IPJ7_9PROT|nr:hypothetical protein [Rhodovastum atsumiense]KAA5610204.1 hypothetical protein F1189_20325 [Rhodovastum atsumiense]CAH2604182.1 conserved protein of unknown function [Rhodovastum atsumiense]
MRRAGCVVLILALLGGCVDRLAERQAFLASLIGKTEPELVQVIGVPTRAIDTGGQRFLAYTETRLDVIPGPGPIPWGRPGWYGPWGYGGFPTEIVARVCETTFEIVDGRVRSYQLRGNACG